jgi:hypothetical protein
MSPRLAIAEVIQIKAAASVSRQAGRKLEGSIAMAPVKLSKITLLLARTKDHPDGSAAHGYKFIAPLDRDGKLDVNVWREHRAACSVHRFWGADPPAHGHLVHRAGGREGATWGFDYDPAKSDDDEAGFRLGSHRFAPGEYVSVKDPHGEDHTFKVAAA